MSKPQTCDYYADLGLSQAATQREIKVAYKKLALLHHPDKKFGAAAADTDEFLKIQAAYEVLQDPAKRALYDQRYAKSQRIPAAYQNPQRASNYKAKRRADDHNSAAPHGAKRQKTASPSTYEIFKLPSEEDLKKVKENLEKHRARIRARGMLHFERIRAAKAMEKAQMKAKARAQAQARVRARAGF
ncbi:DnaJ-domain-containing protein [Diaporthe amygdali]|uniref:DnaJ-domain-containing protein n=1 Tax=Phomopsis amygdali TaxID=1214568 RepID=UPI0022FF0665|nr:DnaJ-domain-containing protein [Diaporthe amygdali]KAJ0124831.1 DnaJ-domain-containing protein [Diaporthe amygdali]